MKNTNLSSNFNPFELGTNEYNQKTTNNSNYGSFLGGLISSYGADSGFETKPQVSSRSLTDIPQNKEQTNPLAFGGAGEAYLKFNRPPDEFSKRYSLEALEQARINESQKDEEKPMNVLEPFIPLDFEMSKGAEVVQEVQIQEELEEDKGIFGGFIDGFLGVFKKTFSFIFKSLPKIGGPTKEMISGFASIGTEGFLVKPERKKSKEEVEAEKKESERGKNKKIFFEKLAQLTRVMPMSEGLRAEMITTNQANAFYEEYVGVLERNTGITTYHSANRRKKEAETRAAKIQKERAAKIQKVSKKAPGFGQREGELLMGAENPSHFTKALG